MLVLLVLLSSPPLRAEVVISEFMASTTRGLADEDGSFEDWIELHNTGPVAVNLDGWFLTDLSTALTQWRFPATNITANGFLVVFASNKDRQTPGRPLHTNFKLSVGGEYLALVQPDGVTVASEYTPTFPPQVANVSFGLDTGLRRIVFLGTNAPGKLVIPADDSLGTNWLARDFNDGNWLSVTSAVGFAIGTLSRVPMPGLTNALVGYWKLDETNGLTSFESSGSGSSNGVLRNFPGNSSQWVPGRNEGGLRFRGTSDYFRVADYPKASNSLSVAAWVWADGRPVWGTIAKNWGAQPGQFHLGLRDSGGNLDVSIHTADGDFNAHEDTLFPTGQWQHVAFTADGATLRLFRNGALVASSAYSGSFTNPPVAALGVGAKLNATGISADGSAPGYWMGRLDDLAIWNRSLDPGELSAIHEAGAAYSDLIRSNLRPSLLDSNATCYARFPFVADNPSALTRWLLRVRYDDGFVAWLNGEEIIRRNAPDTLSWDAVATQAHPTEDASVFEEFNLAAFAPFILPGTNILAFQGLNAGAHDPDFLLQPYLEASSVTNTTNSAVYFTTPTPGAENRVGVQVLGPILAQVQHIPSVPADAEDLFVTARVAPAFGPVATVTLKYRIMFGATNSVPMVDDGAHGDGAAGDGIYGATIPSTLSTNGQMIRYFVSAIDAAGRSSRLPVFNDRLNSDEYFGTIVQNTNVNTVLPVIHWFLATPSAAETDTGTRCSFFFNGEFYDNIAVRIRGGTSRSWPKKSYKFELNDDHEFLLEPGQRTVTEFDLNTTYTDKSYVRSILTYEHQRDIGLPSPQVFAAQLRQNTLFYSVTIYTEQPDKDFLHRNGLDENGVLYKCGPGSNYEAANVNATVFEKKTRLYEPGLADVQALVNGVALSGAALENFIFDNVDLPAQVDFMAAVAITQNIDGSDKNHFLYRDTEGSREWRMLPWDQDLTFGPNALNTDTMVFNEDNATSFTSHPFIGARPYLLFGSGSGKYNRLLEALVKTARGRQMLLRRIRTLSDRFLATSYFQDRIEQLYTLLNPDVQLDHARWKGDAHFSGSNYTLRQALDRIRNEYLAGRVGYLSGNTISGITNNMPWSQPPNALIAIDQVDFNPASGFQAQEYVRLTNANPYAVDVTGWKVTGEIEHRFKPGTVIPSNSVLYLSPDVVQFRARPSGPSGGQGLFVQGKYQGQLSARGGALRVIDAYGRVASSFSYSGAPSPAQQFLRVTEIMFNPAPPAPGSPTTADDFEFVELKNISADLTLNLAGVRFTAGIFFDFTGSAITTLAPGTTVLVVRNPAAFASRYGAGRPVAGAYTGLLDNGGERLRLDDATGEKILEFDYNDTWYPITDGHGFSLVPVNESAAYDTWDDRARWRPSAALQGSPGGDDPAPLALPAVLINEVLTHSSAQNGDAIELRNPTGQAAPVGGWFITDDFRSPKKFRIPGGISVPADGYRVFTEADFNPGGSGFSFGADGDEVWLFSADAAGNLTGYQHGFAFGAAELDVSFGRHVDSQSVEYFVPQGQRTLGAANAGPRVGPVVLSEIMFHPPAGLAEEASLEYIELRNITTSPVPLYDLAAVTNTWRLRKAVKFDFPTGSVLPVGGRVVVVGFDPAHQSELLAQFRAAYAVDSGVTVLGPWEGHLNNAGDTLELQRPNPPGVATVPYVLVESVSYRDQAPWPSADGNGASLQRETLTQFSEDPANWTAATPSPGQDFAGGTLPVLTLQPADRTAIAYQDVTLRAAASGDVPLRFQWRRNGSPLEGETSDTLVLKAVRPEQFGRYQVEVHNGAGPTLSSNALLTVLIPPILSLQPQGRVVAVGANLTLTAGAVGTGTLNYQWQLNGENLPGATSSSLPLKNVQLSDSGDYAVLVTDEVASRVSASASLRVLEKPVLNELPMPESQTVLQGATLRLTISVSGSQPLSYRWRRSNVPLTGQTNASLLITNVQTIQSGNYSVVVTNPVGSATSGSSLVLVLADVDHDGMADEWERAFGFNPADAADAALDTDGDTMSNLAEYIAGTNPTNALEYLVLKMNQLKPGERTASLQFLAISNHTYTILYRDQLDAGAWLKLANAPSRSTNRVENAIDPTPNARRFYRLVTPQQTNP